MTKRKIKPYHQLVEEYKKEIIHSPKQMDMIYEKIDRRHENSILSVSKDKQA
ncbi:MULTISPECIES: Fur-regulated basic protein FbpB [Bacillus]|uniref:Fur-regulated basic protein FbpB n=1 Tax=Bacillus TaxID=1386 RepID=UPI0003F59EDE|nr:MULTISPECIES: Fur-regulated basic protein FbpB [Bacillus]QHZ48535.1 Fur-regulated basic protein FbpB [Bacillus sp. NSP9.1]WFA05829.1 Fur-regulated basic protein FbpB [Bacillus sp. HSf4]